MEVALHNYDLAVSLKNKLSQNDTLLECDSAFYWWTALALTALHRTSEAKSMLSPPEALQQLLFKFSADPER